MPNYPGLRYGSCQQCTRFGGEHLAIVGATFCTRAQRVARGLQAPRTGLHGVGAGGPPQGHRACDRRWPARDYAFMGPDRANFMARR